jgi:acyl-CoA reductase-like NAD-dependent aldehyde dehydrogenase
MDKAKSLTKISKKEMETQLDAQMQDLFMDNLDWAKRYPIEAAAKLLRWYEKLDEKAKEQTSDRRSQK